MIDPQVLSEAVGRLAAGEQPTAKQIARAIGCSDEEAARSLVMHQAQGRLSLIGVEPSRARVVAASAAAYGQCGVWRGHKLVDQLVTALEVAADAPATTPGGREQLQLLASALKDAPPGLLEGVLGSFLFGLDFVDVAGLMHLRSAETE